MRLTTEPSMTETATTAMMTSVDVAVIGGGVSGLAAAYELRKRKRSVVVLEREPRAGRHHP